MTHSSVIEPDRSPGTIRIEQAQPGDAATVRALLVELAEHERSVDALWATEADWGPRVAA